MTAGIYLPFKGNPEDNAHPAADAVKDFRFGLQRDLECRPQAYRDRYLVEWAQLEAFMDKDMEGLWYE